MIFLSRGRGNAALLYRRSSKTVVEILPQNKAPGKPGAVQI